jgi:ribosomal protein L11 methyltransferase
MKYTQITFQHTDTAVLAALEGLLSSIEQLTGFETQDTQIIAYCTTTLFPQAAIDEIADLLHITYTTTTLEDQNWNTLWEQAFEPISIDDFCYIRANFHEPSAIPFAHEIVITPKMSFGTGHHATTQLVIQQMRALSFKNKSVLDFGTGTGILAILAEQLGATKILAIDNDQWSINNSIENVQRNQCKHIEVSDIDIEAIAVNTSFDIILANINRHILTTYMAQMAKLLHKGGQMIISGILEEDIPILQEAIAQNGLKNIQTSSQKNWMCLLIE